MDNIKVRKIKILVNITFILGIILGIFLAINFKSYSDESIIETLNRIVNKTDKSVVIDSTIFLECLVKYGKTILIMWFVAFFPPSFFVVFVTIFLKGLSFSFTSALIVKQFGGEGFKYIISYYLLQNVVLIISYLYFAYSILILVLSETGNDRSVGHKIDFKKLFRSRNIFTKELFFRHLMLLVFGLVMVVLASSIECYVVPNIISML